MYFCYPVKIDRYYRPELDVLRFFAFLIVFIVHRMDFLPIDPAQHYWLYNLCRLGDLGVPVFFLLSAFLITELLLREDDRLGRVHPGAFYMRRMLRIWPLYFAMFFGLAIAERFLPGTGPRDPLSWLAFSLFAGNWYICWHGWIHSYPVNPLWSISVEEQFYIAIPLLAMFGRRLGLKVVSFVLMAVSYAFVIWYAARGGPGFGRQWTNSFVHFQFFAVGTLLSIYLNGRVPNWHPAVRILCAGAAVVCWFVASAHLGVQADAPSSTLGQAPVGWALVLLGAALFFLSLLGAPARWMPKPLIYLGRISYGLYIFHELVYYLVFWVRGSWLDWLCAALQLTAWRGAVGTVIAFGLTVLVAHLSYRFLEGPFLRLKRRFTFVPSRD